MLAENCFSYKSPRGVIGNWRSACVSEGRRPRRPQASSPANGTMPRGKTLFSPDRGCVSRRRIFSRKERKDRKEIFKTSRTSSAPPHLRVRLFRCAAVCRQAAIKFLYQAALDGLSDSIYKKSESSAYASLSHSERCHDFVTTIYQFVSERTAAPRRRVTAAPTSTVQERRWD